MVADIEHTLPALVEAGGASLPAVAWRWESETDILSGTTRSPRSHESAETVELSAENGAVIVLDVIAGDVCGLDVVIWPDVETISGLTAPAPAATGRVRIPPSPEGPWQVETELAVEVDGMEQTFHLLVGKKRPSTVVRIADHLMVEVDASRHLAGFWLTGVPPFPSEE